MNYSYISEETLEKNTRHPCYSKDAHQQYARMHLPVAPRCNIGCNYCNRKYDCVNESRPGVTSEVLSPYQAMEKFALVKTKIPNLSVIGIAGPGDALANWKQTSTSIKLIKQIDKDVIFCLSTNGLMLPYYAQEIMNIGVRHVTVTINAITSEIGMKIYRHIYYQGQKYVGREAVEILISNQMEGLKLLTQQDVIVKVNIVMIPSINDYHILDVVKTVKKMGASISNIMPLIPATGSVFSHLPKTNTADLYNMRKLCQFELPQMWHCKQCRADAIGMLENDRSLEFSKKTAKAVI